MQVEYTKTEAKKTTKMNLDIAQFCYTGSGIGWVSTLYYYIIILLYYYISHHDQINYYYRDKAGDKILFSDNYQVNLTARG